MPRAGANKGEEVARSGRGRGGGEHPRARRQSARRSRQDGKPDRVTVSAKNWAVISERLAPAARRARSGSTGTSGKREKSGKKAAKAAGASYSSN